MGFLLSASIGAVRDCKPPFDITGDLDTPVSAFMKLAAFGPRFLLESVEGGERLGRYSFIGFGDGLEVRLDESGLVVGSERRRCRRAALSCWRAARRAGAGAAAAARHRRRAARRRPGRLRGLRRGALLRAAAGARCAGAGVPALHYVAPRSVLVFDHLTRGIALLHAGAEAERRSLRAEVVRALRGALPNGRRRGRYAAARRGVLARATTWRACGARRNTLPPATCTSWCSPAASAGRHELDPFQAYRALRLINPSPYMYYCALGDVTVVGSSPEALVKLNARPRAAAARSPARGRARRMARSMRRARRNCSRIRRRMPST